MDMQTQRKPKTRTIPRACGQCGVGFFADQWSINKGWGKFCSRGCRDAHKTATESVDCACLHCGETFRAARSELAKGWAKYCSRACHGAAKTAAGTMSCVCQECGATFQTNKSRAHYGGGKYCSPNCSVLGHMNTPETFWARVNKDGPVPVHCPNLGPCWLWTGAKGKHGYGCLGYQKRDDTAHRVAYMLTHGPIPDGLSVLHSCDNPPCCNPAHLTTGTQQENVRQMVQRGRASVGERGGAKKHPERIPRGEQAGMSRLTEHSVREIRRLYAAGGITHRQLGELFGVARRTVGRLITRETWGHVTP